MNRYSTECCNYIPVQKNAGAQPRLKSWGPGFGFWVPTPGRLRLAPGHRPGWVLAAEGVASFRCECPGVSLPENV